MGEVTLHSGHSKKDNKWLVRIGIARTHVHLSEAHVEALFGPGHKLSKLRETGQTGQYYARETVNVVGPKGILREVRIIGPTRPESQVELCRSDTLNIGIDAPIMDSGDLTGTPGGVLVGANGAVLLDHGCIIPRCHIHLLQSEAENLQLKEGDRVNVLIFGKKTVCYHDVLIRTMEKGLTEFHIDTDEANAAYVENGDVGLIKHKEITVRDNFDNILKVNIDNIHFIHCKVPNDRYVHEAIRLYRHVFECRPAVRMNIVQNLLSPESIAPNKFYLLLAVESDQVIGVSSFYYFPDVRLAYLEYLGIAPEFQKRGIGSFYYHKILDLLENEHPEIQGILFEVRKHLDGLDNRQQFYSSLNCHCVNPTLYDSAEIKAGYELLLMYKPAISGVHLTKPTLDRVLECLRAVLL